MIFESTLINAKFIKRYKRFFADVELENGEIVTAHTPNTGAMTSCIGQNWPCLISPSNNPKRKLKYTLEMTHNGQSWIGVHTGRPNAIVAEAIMNKEIPELTEFDTLMREVKRGDSRIDICLDTKEGPHFVEVKNVTLKKQDELCSFPDAVSTRGQKHLDELIDIVNQGEKASMFYLVQREDVSEFTPAIDIDPVYALKLEDAYAAGVGILVYQCELNENEIKIKKKLPIRWPND